MTKPTRNSNEPTSLSLLAGIRENDPEAWSQFNFVFTPVIYQWCRKSGLQAEDARDVSQDVLHAVVRGLANFRRLTPNDSFRAWLRRIAQNCVADWYRERCGEPNGVGGTDMQIRVAEIASTTSETEERAEVRLLVARVFELVRTDYEESTARAFELVMLEGYSSVEAAAQLGLTPGAVRTAKYRILKRLREELNGLAELL